MSISKLDSMLRAAVENAGAADRDSKLRIAVQPDSSEGASEVCTALESMGEASEVSANGEVQSDIAIKNLTTLADHRAVASIRMMRIHKIN